MKNSEKREFCKQLETEHLKRHINMVGGKSWSAMTASI